MSQERLISAEAEVEIKAKGSSPSEAINKAFTQLRTDIYQRFPGPIVHMEPIGVKVEKPEIKRYTERFMGVLWPRKKQDVEMSVKIRVAVKYISLEGIN